MTIVVRPALPDEFYRIEELSSEIRAETRYAAFGLNITKLQLMFDMQFQSILNHSTIVFFALWPEKGIDHTIGFGAFVTHPTFFSDERIASDLMTYVHPLYRGSRAFFRLTKAYEKWAVSEGVREINLTVSTGIETERTSSLYSRLGYPLSAVTHTKCL